MILLPLQKDFNADMCLNITLMMAHGMQQDLNYNGSGEDIRSVLVSRIPRLISKKSGPKLEQWQIVNTYPNLSGRDQFAISFMSTYYDFMYLFGSKMKLDDFLTANC